MATLKLLAASVAVASLPPAISDPVARWRPFVEEASSRFGVPVTWIEHVMGAESGGETMAYGAPIRSAAGAIGLMQLMPATWASLRSTLHLGSNPDDPHDNILAGASYLRAMYDRFGYPGLFGAYNVGPTRFARHLATGVPLPAETQAYLLKVTGAAAARTISSRAVRPTPSVFVIAPGNGSDRPPALFLPLSASARGVR